jgi:activator of HSP90 ATPase
MVLHNPNNWHWVNKDVSGWTREYLDKELAQISAEQDGVTAHIDKVVSMDGDVDVSQRKGKVRYVTLPSLPSLGELTRSAGKNKEGEEASGTITVPEVAHDTEEDEYVVCSLCSPLRSYFVSSTSTVTNTVASLR